MIPKGKSKYSSDVSNVDVNIGGKLATGYFNDNADLLPRAVNGETDVQPQNKNEKERQSAYY